MRHTGYAATFLGRGLWYWVLPRVEGGCLGLGKGLVDLVGIQIWMLGLMNYNIESTSETDFWTLLLSCCLFACYEID